MAPRKKKQKITTSSSSSSSSASTKKKADTDDDESKTASSKFIIILSPAKTLDLNCDLPEDEPIKWSQPGHVSIIKTNEIKNCMKNHSKSVAKLSKLVGVSTKLGETAKSYWDDMDVIDSSSTQKQYKAIPCAFLFQGPAYQGMDISTCSVSQIQYLQTHLRIVDPLWGWLRPMDAIPPYRLEMNTKNVFGTGDKKIKLAEYWKPEIQSVLSLSSSSKGKEEEENNNNDHDDENNTVIINLASDEYASAVVPSTSSAAVVSTTTTTIKVVFQTNGRVLGVHAKRARGLYVRYLAQNEITTIAKFYEMAPNFNIENYTYQEDKSHNDDSNNNNNNIVVYDRTSVPKPPAKKRSKK